MSARAISDLERGVKALPHRHTVELLAGALGIPVGDLECAIERRRGPRTHRGTVQLSVPPTSFVGRDAEVRSLTTLLRQPGTRLVTVTGAHGDGKTRLTLAAAELVAEKFADGAIFIPLVPIRDAPLVPELHAHTLDVPFVDPISIEQQFIDHLRTTPPLRFWKNAWRSRSNIGKTT